LELISYVFLKHPVTLPVSRYSRWSSLCLNFRQSWWRIMVWHVWIHMWDFGWAIVYMRHILIQMVGRIHDGIKWYSG